MIIAIPTMGRVDKQDTAKELEECGYPVILFAPDREVVYLRSRGHVVASVPDKIQGIAATRMFIMNSLNDEHIVMMDDDLTFARRRADEPEKFRTMATEDYHDMLSDVEDQLKQYAHVSIAMREGGNRDTADYKTATRVARVIGYQRSVFFATGANFENSTVMDDFEVTLHLLTRGYPNKIINRYVQNQRGSGTEGGASAYRTPTMHASAAHTLAERYPRYVRTVLKNTRVAWGGGLRKDVIVQWKKALQESINAGK